VNSQAKPIAVPDKDLIDRVADSLPVEVRADYYREMRHCRSLPENDEMLRILRAMQFLTLDSSGSGSPGCGARAVGRESGRLHLGIENYRETARSLARGSFEQHRLMFPSCQVSYYPG
jgi:hypothetical protein